MHLIISGMRGRTNCSACQRIGLEVSGRTWVSMEPLEEEVRNTQWLGGLIVLAASDSELRKGETFQEFRARTVSAVTGDQPLYAFHVPFFDLQKMEFTERSRLVRL